MCARNSSAAWLSRCACSSRTKCAGSARSWACRTTWSGVSRSPAPAWPSASWATSRRDKLEIVRESDAILREEVALAGLDRDINQYFTVLTNTRTVGVMGDERTHDFVLAIRAVTTDDFMTVDWARLPYDLLAKVSARIVNEVPRVNRVVYDITTKPPATVEWE